MNLDELIEKHGNADRAAGAIAEGHEGVRDGDFMAWPDSFQRLILFKQLALVTPTELSK